MGNATARLDSLKEQHRKLDHSIKQMEAEHADDTMIRAAKIQKLHIKEEIESLGHAGISSN